MNIPLSRGGIMKKIQKLSFASFIFSVFALLYLVPSVSAQVDAHMNGGQSRLGAGQCDSNPACDPTSGTCCNQCDPNPACVADDPHAIPCCSSNGGDIRDPRGGGERDPRGPANPPDPRASGAATAPDDRPWRDILKNCRQMKKKGALTGPMKKECKRARAMKKGRR